MLPLPTLIKGIRWISKSFTKVIFGKRRAGMGFKHLLMPKYQKGIAFPSSGKYIWVFLLRFARGWLTKQDPHTTPEKESTLMPPSPHPYSPNLESTPSDIESTPSDIESMILVNTTCKELGEDKTRLSFNGDSAVVLTPSVNLGCGDLLEPFQTLESLEMKEVKHLLANDNQSGACFEEFEWEYPVTHLNGHAFILMGQCIKTLLAKGSHEQLTTILHGGFQHWLQVHSAMERRTGHDDEIQPHSFQTWKRAFPEFPNLAATKQGSIKLARYIKAIKWVDTQIVESKMTLCLAATETWSMSNKRQKFVKDMADYYQSMKINNFWSSVKKIPRFPPPPDYMSKIFGDLVKGKVKNETVLMVVQFFLYLGRQYIISFLGKEPPKSIMEEIFMELWQEICLSGLLEVEEEQDKILILKSLIENLPTSVLNITKKILKEERVEE
ncbi:uncharacterized protein LOC142490481 [Ascaphus truei]|uniref:uncharacterized protein LOC142490481 n=1 Tax=Ascaphus truei TaxID=8439 RepID=UPI003F5A0647